MQNVLLLAIPLFLSMIAVEAIVGRRRGHRVYDFNETITNLSCGLGQQVVDIAFKFIIFFMYERIHADLAPVQLPTTWWSVLLLVVVVDLTGYWFHRATHRTALLWAVHAVHHQPLHFNYSVGLRLPWLQRLMSFFVYLPPAFLGFSAKTYVIVVSIHAIAQIWTHTRLIQGELPAVAWLLVTPSHHRVHHGKNPRYCDKNYGALLCVWDRLFGTFERETEPVEFGVTDGQAGFDPLAANFGGLVHLWRKVRRTRSWRERLQVPFRPPGWTPPSLEPAATEPAAAPRPAADWVPGLRLYVLVRYVFILYFAVVLLLSIERLTTTQVLVGGGFLLYSLVTVGMILEGARGATARELLRIVTFVVALWWMPDPDVPHWRWLEASIHGVSLFSLACVVYFRWVLYPRSNLRNTSSPPSSRGAA